MSKRKQRRQKKIIAAIVTVAVVLISAGGIYFVSSKQGSRTPVGTKPTASSVDKKTKNITVPETNGSQDEEEEDTANQDDSTASSGSYYTYSNTSTETATSQSNASNTTKPQTNTNSNTNTNSGSNSGSSNEQGGSGNSNQGEDQTDNYLYELDSHDANKLYMQDITLAMIDEWEDDSTHTLTDRRTGIDYDVVKGYDGYWNPTLYMTSGLRLGSEDQDMVLTPKHTSIYSDYILPAKSDQDGSYKPATAMAGRYPSKEELMDADYGAYNTEESICPKGWRLPSASENFRYNDIGETDFNQETHLIRNTFNKYLMATGTIRVPMNGATSEWNTAYGVYTINEDYDTIFAPLDEDVSLEALCMFGKPMVLNRHLKFDYNGGDEYGETEYEEDVTRWTRWGSDYRVYAYPEREGYSLLGWSRNKNATEPEYGSTIDLSEVEGYDATFYAVWGKNVALTFNANGSTFENGETENTVIYPAPRMVSYSSKDANGNQKTGEFDESDYKKGYSEYKKFSFMDGPVKVRIRYNLADTDMICFSEGTWNEDAMLAQIGKENPSCPDGVALKSGEYPQYPAIYYPDGSIEVGFTIKSTDFGIAFHSFANGDHYDDGLYGFYLEAVEEPYPISGEELWPEYQNDGRIIIGWSTDPDAEYPEYEYQDEWNNPMGKSIFTIDKDTTLYAIWGYPIGH